jgi:hypothetical protein
MELATKLIGAVVGATKLPAMEVGTKLIDANHLSG